MNFLVKHKGKIIAVVAVLAILLIAFVSGGGIPVKENTDAVSDVVTQAPAATQIPSVTPNSTEEPTAAPTPTSTPAVNAKQSATAVPKKEEPQKEQETVEATKGAVREEKEEVNKELSCTLSVRCDTILSNMSLMTAEKKGIVPQDGVIFSERTVTFYEGESVFNLLVREMKKNGIHLEFVNVPVYNSSYIEGIANIYEFDCGELSGWMYKVNGQFPNYGCSSYQLKSGDRVEFVYTCDLGNDVGGGYSARNGM